MSNTISLQQIPRFSLADGYRPAKNGVLYIGKPDTDVKVAANQISVYYLDTSLTEQTLAQPIQLDPVGRPTDNNGTVVEIYAKENYALMVIDVYGMTQFSGNNFYIERVDTLSELRNIEPAFPKQRIFVAAHDANWKNYGATVPTGGGYFVFIPSFSSINTIDDDGIAVITQKGKTWVRENFYLNEENTIHVSWFGGISNFNFDSTAAIQQALTSASRWGIQSNSSSRGILRKRWRVTFTPKWAASSTITFNPVLAELDFADGTGIFLSTGSYDAHPKDSTTPMCFYLKCEKPGNPGSDLYIPAYNDFPLASNGSLCFGSVSGDQPAAGVIYNVTPTTRHCLFAHNGVSETLYTALGTLQDISISGFGLGYQNGDYAWGVRFVRIKFSNNGAMACFRNHLDNGERFDFINCMSMNNARGFEFNDWSGQINWLEGSFDYFKEDAPFTWNSGGKAIFSIMQAHFEFNAYVTGCMFDLTQAHENANVSIRDSFIVLAVGTDDGGVIDNAFIKRKYAHHAVVNNVTIVDVSASGQFTKNYLFFEDVPLPALAENMNPVTLKDYFVASPFLNRQRIAKWQFYFVGSVDFVPTFTDDSISVAGSSSAVAGQDKSLFVFIPAADIKNNVQFLMGMLTCTRCDVNVAFAMWTGYSKSTAPGLVNSSDIVIDQPVGAEQLVTLKVGRNTSVTAFAGGEANPGGYTLADWSRPLFNKPAEGLIVRIWLYNQGPGDTVTLSANSGLITL